MELHNTAQDRTSLPITEYAARLASSGIPVLSGAGGTIWVQHDTGAMMRVPRFHLAPPASDEARQVPWRGRIAVGSYLLAPDHLHPANACLYVCTDRTYTLDKLPPAVRRNVRRGSWTSQ